jgi:serine protease Do
LDANIDEAESRGLVMKALKIKYILIVLVITLSLLVSSCAALDTNGSAPADSGSPVDNGGAPPAVEDNTLVLPSIADVVALVKPSVVAINVEVTVQDIFGQSYQQQGAGSGWIIDTDGIIVTNNHVVAGADSITVTLDDGRIFSVDTNNVATDAVSDLAVLRIDANNLPAVAVGDSAALRVGDWVVAIGNALGEGISATNGIVSRQDVSITDETGLTRYNLIQTNAAINPGNSGGPLVNLAGEVIGITNAKISAVGIEGTGYAISSDSATPIIEELIQNGYVVRPFLGVQNLLTVDQSVAAYYGLSVDTGAMIRGVIAGGPADDAGLQAGDVITKLGDQEVADVNELLQALYASQIGQDVEITFWRGSSQQTAHVILAETPPPS